MVVLGCEMRFLRPQNAGIPTELLNPSYLVSYILHSITTQGNSTTVIKTPGCPHRNVESSRIHANKFKSPQESLIIYYSNARWMDEFSRGTSIRGSK